MRKGRSPYACAIRNRASVAHQVIPVVPLGTLNCAERLAYRHYRTPAHAQEMRDQRLNIVHGARFHRGRGQMVIRLVRPFGHILHALIDDAEALPHLLNANHRAVVAIAAFSSWNVELKLIVSGVRLPFAKIPIEPASAKVGTS